MRKQLLFLLGILNIVTYFSMVLNSIGLSVGGYLFKDILAMYNKNSFILWGITILSIIMLPIMAKAMTLATKEDLSKQKRAFNILCVLAVLMVVTGVGGLLQLILMIPFLIILKIKASTHKTDYIISAFTVFCILTYGYLIGGLVGILWMVLIIIPIMLIMFLSKKLLFVVKFRFTLVSIAITLIFVGVYFYSHKKPIEPNIDFTQNYQNIEKFKEEAIKEVEKMPFDSLYVKKLTRLNNTDNVVLYFSGGATTEIGEKRDYFFDDLPEDIDIVNINQIQFTHAFDFADEKTSNDKLLKMNLVNAAIAKKLASKFASEGKKVIITGHSYGAFLVPFSLTNYPEMQKDLVGAAMLAGRLKMPEKVAFNFNKGNVMSFDDKNGGYVDKSIPMYLITNFEEKLKNTFSAPISSHNVSGYVRTMTNMAAVNSMVGGIDYTKAMNLKSPLKFIGVYANNDNAVGAFTDEEIEFANKIGEVILVEDGTHQLKGLEDKLNIRIKEIFEKN